MSVNNFKLSKEDFRFSIINASILTLFFIIVIYPLYYIVICSFSSGTAMVQNQVKFWPVGFNLDGYYAIFKYKMIITGYMNSIYYTFVGTIVNVIITIMAAYPLSRRDLKGRGVFTFIFAFTMIFNAGIIPNYMLVKDIGLLNSRWAIIIPGALSVWNMIITRTYFQNSVPDELLEAAQIDNCSNFKFLIRIVLPLSKSIIAVITLFYAISHWNAFFNAMIYLKDAEMFPLQLILRDILISNKTDSSMLQDIDMNDLIYKENIAQILRYSVIICASLPMLILYPLVQKYFVTGIMVGAIKG